MHGWGHGDRATNEYFEPIETFTERFAEILRDIRALGFDAIDLWTSHLNPTWATDAHITAARDLLRQHKLQLVSIGGWFGATREEFEATCRLATALDCAVLGGSTSLLTQDRAWMVARLKAYGLKLGLENHPEKTPEEMLAKIGNGGEGTVGACIDTGWFGTQGYSAPQAIEALRDHLFHVHLKDVLHVGEPHETCRYGQGIVPIEACVRMLQRIGYAGAIAVEHEPEDHDPSEDVKTDLAMLRVWLGQ